jgi:hypothetical protein
MPAGFNALCDDEVTSGVGRSLGFLERTDLPERQRTALVDTLDYRTVGLTPEDIDDSRVRCRPLELLGHDRNVEGEEPDAHRVLGSRLHPPQLLVHR